MWFDFCVGAAVVNLLTSLKSHGAVLSLRATIKIKIQFLIVALKAVSEPEQVQGMFHSDCAFMPGEVETNWLSNKQFCNN